MSLRVLACLLFTSAPLLAASPALRTELAAQLAADYPSLESLYRHFHANPELSLMEEKTAAKLAAELRDVGCEVTEHFGGTGVVAVLKNGDGPTLLLRADLDALPVREETGLPYASTVRVKDLAGDEVPVMHACGHDLHLTVLVGAARRLAALKDHWRGTLLLIGQPAEERGLGARAMLTAGLYRLYPKPDYAIALHDSATLPAGTVGTLEGFIMANVETLEITVRGQGGHGAAPHLTKDPVVLAARIVLALQTIVSRELRPGEPAVVTVGSIHGGTKSNIIPDEVKLQLTLRSYSDDTRRYLVDAIARICRGEALAAGLPEDRLPVLTLVENDFTPSLYNDPALTQRITGVLSDWLGSENLKPIQPEMIGEDFSRYGRTTEKVPSTMIRLGAVAPKTWHEAQRTGAPLPSLHSSKFAPAPEPTIKTGVTVLTAAALDLLAR
jgi:amidohydrolase